MLLHQAASNEYAIALPFETVQPVRTEVIFILEKSSVAFRFYRVDSNKRIRIAIGRPDPRHVRHRRNIRQLVQAVDVTEGELLRVAGLARDNEPLGAGFTAVECMLKASQPGIEKEGNCDAGDQQDAANFLP